MNELSERFAKGKQISEMLCGEIRSSSRGRCAFAAYLNDANDFTVEENGRANNLLDRFRALAT